MSVTDSDFKMVLDRIEHIESVLRISSKPVPRDTPAEGTIPRGKYRGRLHADIVKADPQHVHWMAEQGFAASFGYTEQQIEDAKCAIQLQEED